MQKLVADLKTITDESKRNTESNIVNKLAYYVQVYVAWRAREPLSTIDGSLNANVDEVKAKKFAFLRRKNRIKFVTDKMMNDEDLANILSTPPNASETTTFFDNVIKNAFEKANAERERLERLKHKPKWL